MNERTKTGLGILQAMNFAGQGKNKNKFAQRLQKAESGNDFRSWNISRRRAQMRTKSAKL